MDYFFLKLTDKLIKWDRERGTYAGSSYD
jgi:hypothetical protein